MIDETYKRFLVSYRFDGAEWNVELHARNVEDAKARLARMPYATVDGELVMTLPGPTGPLAVIIAACRNTFVRLLRPVG